MHITREAPPQGSELVTVQYKNSVNGESRGVFIEDGLVVYVTMYHKNIGSTGKSKVIHRYLPREVGELVVYYLWFALLFWTRIKHAASGQSIKTSAFIWELEREKEWARPQHKRRRLDAHLQGSSSRS